MVPDKPRLRSLETIVIPDSKHGRVLVLRDTQGIAERHAVIPPALVPIVARMTGAFTTEEIARDAAREMGTHVPTVIVDNLARELDGAFLLEGATFDARLREVKRVFAEGKHRPASHAGGAYPGDPEELANYIDSKCLSHATKKSRGPMLGLVSPHIDPWRGAKGYGHAYAALARALPKDAETFVLLGTSHAPMRQPFALTRKSYDTPLGALAPNMDAIEALEKASKFDPYDDELNHKREHSIEFQAVFLKHALGDRPARIVPILAGLGDQQGRREPPRKTANVARFVDALQKIVSKDPGKVVVIAGADMAHVGPRFGDPNALNAKQRQALQETDDASLKHASQRDSEGFWDHVASDLDTRRVCGLAPMWTMLEVMPKTQSASVLHYEQTIDDEDGSIVSHAAVGFFGEEPS